MTGRTKLTLIAVAALIAAAVFYGVHEFGASSAPSGPMVQPVESGVPSPSPGRVVMIDLGATDCIPCKMMAPILEELKEEYGGTADIIFIDVWKQPDAAEKYGVQIIPTQIFFDADGREVQRHTGFLDKKSIVDILFTLGVS